MFYLGLVLGFKTNEVFFLFSLDGCLLESAFRHEKKTKSKGRGGDSLFTTGR
jgi:hypothetical protein